MDGSATKHCKPLDSVARLDKHMHHTFKDMTLVERKKHAQDMFINQSYNEIMTSNYTFGQEEELIDAHKTPDGKILRWVYEKDEDEYEAHLCGPLKPT